MQGRLGGVRAEALFLGIVAVLYMLEVVAVALLLILPPVGLAPDIILYLVSMAALSGVAVYIAAGRVAGCVEPLASRDMKCAGRELAENAWLRGHWKTLSRVAEDIVGSRTALMLIAAGSLGLAYPAALALLHSAYNTVSRLAGREAVPPAPGVIVASFGLLYPLAYLRYKPLA